MTRTVICERETGRRTVCGTEHAVRDQIVRDQRPGRRATWIVTRGLCNGTADNSDEYATLSEARAAFGQVETVTDER